MRADAGKRGLGLRQAGVRGGVELGRRAQTGGQDAARSAAAGARPGPRPRRLGPQWPPPTLSGLQRPRPPPPPGVGAQTVPDDGGGGQGGLQRPCSPPPGCCSQRAPGSPRRGLPLGPGAVTASSATQPTTWPGTCRAASIAATPSARRACGGWTRWPTSSAGSPARSAARAHPRPVEGWPCWTSTWPPSWLSGLSGSRLAWSPSVPRPPKAAPLSLSSQPGSAPPWAPSPTSPSPDAAAAAASAGTPWTVPRSEFQRLPPPAEDPLSTACLWWNLRLPRNQPGTAWGPPRTPPDRSLSVGAVPMVP